MLLFSHLCCHIIIIFLLITDFISFLPRGTLTSTKFFFNAFFANLCAVSFPTIPICAGTQQKYTIIPSTFSLYSDVYISTSRSSLSVFVDFILLRADEESEQITILFGLICSTHCNPIIIAVNSVDYADNLSLNLKLISVLNLGIYTPMPTFCSVGSLDPSV